MREEISCGAVVYRLNPTPQILLVKQNNNFWGIPKGHMEPGETFLQTACREVEEETGIKIKLLSRLNDVIIEKKNFKKTIVSFLAVQICKSQPNSNNKNSEVLDADWFDIFCLPPILRSQTDLIESSILLL